MPKRKRSTKTTANKKGMIKALKGKNLTDTIALGATGVAITAGVVAAGAAMMNRKTREKLSEGAKNVAESISSYAADMTENYQTGGYRAVASQITKGQGRGRRSKRS